MQVAAHEGDTFGQPLENSMQGEAWSPSVFPGRQRLARGFIVTFSMHVWKKIIISSRAFSALAKN